MPPLWLAYPENERYSIGWRMGSSEDYVGRFFDWMNTLSLEEQAEYQALFPEPVAWKGWWINKDTSDEMVMLHGEFFLLLWQPEGIPKYSLFQLQQAAVSGKKQDLCLFWKGHSSKDGSITKNCFSQWYMSEFWSISKTYCCMEQFMMAQKAELFEDKEILKQILECKDPGRIKALGRKVRGFDQALWDRAKYSIVLNGNWCKFSQNQELRNFLLSTGDRVLVEASPYDSIWGIGLSADSPNSQNPLKWHGKNLLGFALMEIRDELRRITQNESLCDWDMIVGNSTAHTFSVDRAD